MCFIIFNKCLLPETVVLQQVKVTLNDEDMDTFVFAVGTKKAMARLQKEMQDLVNHPHPSMFDAAAPALTG